eukprot:TRINITY_DN5611_c0_g1_i6.p1 TRINITY_DN5611_c0_g1~~TRINITY_DN5611_c0_g1_i6.p1  ORF type:complete len:336 (-),score=37.04 TRINITY_DN5611_c0_g1_i6:130-1137(-)
MAVSYSPLRSDLEGLRLIEKYLQMAESDCNSEATTHSGRAEQPIGINLFEDNSRPCTPDANTYGSIHRPLVASVGSALHGTGECRPCAWFWKQQGCFNAADCRHCHLCPKTEIKARRKAKRVAVVAGGRSGDLYDALQPHSFDMFPGESAPEHTRGLSSHHSVKEEYSAMDPFPQRTLLEECPLELQKFQELPTKMTTATSMPGLRELADTCQVPSVGSHLHGTGTSAREALLVSRRPRGFNYIYLPCCFFVAIVFCVLRTLQEHPPAPDEEGSTTMCRPCAWYWKPQGCNNGTECFHCHLCPPGEHAARRRSKTLATDIARLLATPDELPYQVY